MRYKYNKYIPSILYTAIFYIFLYIILNNRSGIADSWILDKIWHYVYIFIMISLILAYINKINKSVLLFILAVFLVSIPLVPFLKYWALSPADFMHIYGSVKATINEGVSVVLDEQYNRTTGLFTSTAFLSILNGIDPYNAIYEFMISSLLYSYIIEILLLRKLISNNSDKKYIYSIYTLTFLVSSCGFLSYILTGTSLAYFLYISYIAYFLAFLSYTKVKDLIISIIFFISLMLSHESSFLVAFLSTFLMFVLIILLKKFDESTPLYLKSKRIYAFFAPILIFTLYEVYLSINFYSFTNGLNKLIYTLIGKKEPTVTIIELQIPISEKIMPVLVYSMRDLILSGLTIIFSIYILKLFMINKDNNDNFIKKFIIFVSIFISVLYLFLGIIGWFSGYYSLYYRFYIAIQPFIIVVISYGISSFKTVKSNWRSSLLCLVITLLIIISFFQIYPHNQFISKKSLGSHIYYISDFRGVTSIYCGYIFMYLNNYVPESTHILSLYYFGSSPLGFLNPKLCQKVLLLYNIHQGMKGNYVLVGTIDPMAIPIPYYTVLSLYDHYISLLMNENMLYDNGKVYLFRLSDA
ncbi:MAG: hypothetical protein QXK55_06570 [Nitrososphaeria archaeon]